MSNSHTDSLQAVLKFPLEDKVTRNHLIIGSALTFASFIIPIIPGLFVAGYLLVIMRNTIMGDELSLPAWTDWGQLAFDGLKGGVIGVVFMLPTLIVSGVGMAAYFSMMFSPAFLAGLEQHPEAVGAYMASLLGSMAVFFLAMALSMLLALLGSIPLPAALAHFAAGGELRDGFRRREWWPILRRAKWAYFVAWVVVMGLMGLVYVLSIVGCYTIVLCIVMPFLMAPATFYVAVVGAALFGQAYRDGMEPEKALDGMGAQ